VSEEIMSLYAANNIARSVLTYSGSGIFLAGLVANLRSRMADRAILRSFARRLGTRILAFLPRDAQAGRAELRRVPVVDYAPEAAISRELRRLARKLLRLAARDAAPPTPLTDEEFDAWVRRRRP